MLPSWVDVTVLKWFSLGGVVVVLLLNLFVIRMAQRMAIRAVMFLILISIAVTFWIYRDNLDECRRTCSCSLVGFDVDFSPAEDRVCNLNANN